MPIYATAYLALLTAAMVSPLRGSPLMATPLTDVSLLASNANTCSLQALGLCLCVTLEPNFTKYIFNITTGKVYYHPLNH